VCFAEVFVKFWVFQLNKEANENALSCCCCCFRYSWRGRQNARERKKDYLIP
jgi:hypothetical protein